MELTERKSGKDVSEFKVPLGIRIISSVHSVEANLSESIYKFWCKFKGGKFERKNALRPNACILVTKRSSRIFATSVIFLSSILRPFSGLFFELARLFAQNSAGKTYLIVTHLCSIELEVYELNCPEEASFGQGQREFRSAFKEKENCVMCGRCFEIRETDKKIIGKF